MKRFLSLLIPLLLSGSIAKSQVVSLSSLLKEMADPSVIAAYPKRDYQALEATSYNRASVSPDQPGWFADSDGISWIREERNGGKTEYVIMEQDGPGCLTRLWTPYFYYNLNNHKGPNVRIYLDGNPTPVIDECFIDLLTGKGSIKPPFATLTARAGVCYLPIPYAKSCKITLTDKPFYHIVNYRAYEKKQRVKTFSLEQYQRAAKRIGQTARELASPPPVKATFATAKYFKLTGEESFDLPAGSHAVRQLMIRLDPQSGHQALRSTILVMTFDGEKTVWCPVGDFFSCTDKIHPFHTFDRTVQADGTMICRYVMPYEQSASVKLVNLQDQPVDVRIELDLTPWKWSDRSMHFGASWNPVGTLPGDRFEDMNFIDIKGKGVLAGDALTVLSPGHGWWGEGDEKIYIDETDVARRFPSHFGTGTEDYYGWAGGVVPTGRDTFSIPIGANICNGNEADPRGYNICTRNRILDAIPFRNRLVFDMEASPGTNIRHPLNLLDYSLVTFWYTLPGAVTNIPARWDVAARPVMTLGKIDSMQEFLQDGSLTFGENPGIPLRLTARPDQFFVFSLKLAAGQSIENLQISYPVLHPEPASVREGLSALPIMATRFTCFNAGGIDERGKPFTKRIDIPAGAGQDLYFGVDLDQVKAGIYSGTLVFMSGGKRQLVPLELTVAGDPIPDHGYDEGKTLARLNWLNSTVGENDSITKGYEPVKVTGDRIDILGRSMEVGPDGLPAALTTFFGPSNQEIRTWGEPLINSGFRFIIEKADGQIVKLKPGKMTISQKVPSKATWRVNSTSPDFDLECTGEMDYDGLVDYHLKLTARTAVGVKDIRLEIPMNKDKAEYMMGLNHEGGFRTPDWKWKWDVTKNQDMLWVGDVNGGLRIKWKAENYRRPLVNIYYSFGPLNLPPSWGNGGKGGVNLSDKGKDVVIDAYSGPRELASGQVLNYDFELLLTPFRTMSKKVQYGDRYYHGGGTDTSVKIAAAKAAGANIINIHHAEDLYPFINYPYLDENIPDLKKLVADAHHAGMRMKFYYTTRELTKNLPEFQAFYSLNGEVIFPGPGENAKTLINPNGPADWLKKNLPGGKYIPAWFNLVKEGRFKGETDLSVITTPDSRLNNFYVAGLDWMVRNIKIDGVYIDDSALDRFTLQRARKVIDRSRPEGRMDLHSWNHFNKWAGFASCLNLYMDLLPYFDQVWIGEGRDYNRMPDHWLIEVSGIPFGLPGQMLEGGGNPWRGMVYGITTRAGWMPNPPGPLWRFWDEFHIQDTKMIGYWDPQCPVKSANKMVEATVYRGNNQSIISIANWSPNDQSAKMTIDWKKLGLDPGNTEIFMPEVENFQAAHSKVNLNNLILPGGKGYLIILKAR
jgi:hypothetical protein